MEQLTNRGIFQQDTASTSGTQFNFKSILAFVVMKWYWMVLSLIVCCGAAGFYLMRTPPQYTRTISLLIKNEDGKKKSQNSSVDLTALGVVEAKTNLDNELRIITSPPLVEEVVSRLNLNDQYFVKDGLRTTEIYRGTPAIFADVDTVKTPSVSFSFLVKPDNKIDISDIVINGEALSSPITASFGDTVNINDRRFAVIKPDWDASKYIDKTLKYRHESTSAAAAALAGRLSAALIGEKSSIIDISIVYPSVAEADKILTTLVEVYNENWILEKNKMAVSTSRFIDERLAVIEKDLGNVDTDISSYKSEHLLPDVKAATSLYISQSSAAQAATVDFETQIAIAEMIRRQLVGESFDMPLPTNTALVNADIESSIAQYNNLVIERNRLLETTSEINPVVKDRTQALRTLKTNIRTSLDSFIAMLRTQLSSARRQASEATSKIASNPTQAKYLLSVERQQKVKESLYLFLLQKREENELTQAFTAYNTRIIDFPHYGGPTTPDSAKIWMIAFLLGLALPIGYFVVREMLDGKIRGKKDLEGLKIPYMGEIPSAANTPRGLDRFKNKKSVQERKIVVKPRSSDVVNEAFRVVRTNLDFMSVGKEGSQVIAVTSANPGSGKTFISINLAKAIALNGAKVLVVDLDIRKGSLSKLVGGDSKGIVDFFIGKAGSQEIVERNYDDTPGLDVVCVGTIPPNPSELLSSERLDSFIAEMREHYDYILIDCPPVEIVTDALIINRVADVTLFIIRSGLFDREELGTVQGYFDKGRYKNLAIILNGTDLRAGYSYHRYGYHYGYGYRYGYGNKAYGASK